MRKQTAIAPGGPDQVTDPAQAFSGSASGKEKVTGGGIAAFSTAPAGAVHKSPAPAAAPASTPQSGLSVLDAARASNDAIPDKDLPEADGLHLQEESLKKISKEIHLLKFREPKTSNNIMAWHEIYNKPIHHDQLYRQNKEIDDEWQGVLLEFAVLAAKAEGVAAKRQRTVRRIPGK